MAWVMGEAGRRACRFASSAWRYLVALGSRFLPEPGDSARMGETWTPGRAGDVLLVVGEPRGDGPAPPNWSWEWLNTVVQEVGPVAVAEPGAISVTGRRVVIVTRSCAGLPVDVMALEAWVESGGVLLVELPDQRLEPLAGVRVDTGPRDSGSISRVAASLLPDEAICRLQGFRVHARWWKATPLPGIEAAPLLWIDDYPVLFGRRLGRGAVLGLTLDHGAALVAWLQGPPPAGFRVRERRGRVPGIVEPDDLVAHPDLLANPVPVANLYQRAVMGAVRLFTPLPAWWPIPEGRGGACLLTHDDEGEPGECLMPLIEEERRHGFEPSVYVVADAAVGERWPSRADHAGRPDLHLHWNRYVMRGGRRHAVVEQRRDLERLGVGEVASRLHFLDWGRDWDGPFQVLSGCGVTADASLGPNDGWGYLFGSGLPYLVVDRHGLPFVTATTPPRPLLEMPFHSQEDWGGITPEAMEAMLRSAAGTDHVGVVSLFHAGRSVTEARGQALWQRIMGVAEELGMWRGSMRDWLAWHHARAANLLVSEWDADARRLHIRSQGPGVLHLPWAERIRGGEARSTTRGGPLSLAKGVHLLEVGDGESLEVDIDYGP